MAQTRARLAGLLLPAAAAGGATLAWALATRAVSTARNPLLTVDGVVESSVVAVGAVAAAWLAVSCALAALCVGARTVGLTWRAGERAVQRFAPAAVRRVLGVAVATTLAATVATGAGAAETLAGPAAAPVGQPAGQVQVVDLGWLPSTAVTEGATRPAARPTAARTPVPDDLGWVPSGPAHDETSVRSDERTPAPSPTASPTPSGPAASSDDGHTATTEVAPEPAAPRTTPARRTSAQPAEAPFLTPTTSAPANRPTSRTSRAAGAASDDVVVVRPGDTLWSIAADHLGSDASTRDVAAAWPAWFHANADEIGDDPDHIVPGQRLTVPTSSARPRSSTTSTEGTHR
ncbi:LysM peptidoglycan-binding domain-containing protein [Cellulomonas sp. JH27-2]|uniref:LysM peptidoglycan-binding domain-containing protein n=1 Tax=Cellulomonas sp. JH27-2 TaxID=2774139 RepID=UPI001CD8CB2D|nr:LysM peptidoglycan-binding domain-containing protein [Cellulomonas sp. JH27-2]